MGDYERIPSRVKDTVFQLQPPTTEPSDLTGIVGTVFAGPYECERCPIATSAADASGS
jgi:hypothetical protein